MHHVFGSSCIWVPYEVCRVRTYIVWLVICGMWCVMCGVRTLYSRWILGMLGRVGTTVLTASSCRVEPLPSTPFLSSLSLSLLRLLDPLPSSPLLSSPPPNVKPHQADPGRSKPIQAIIQAIQPIQPIHTDPLVWMNLMTTARTVATSSCSPPFPVMRPTRRPCNWPSVTLVGTNLISCTSCSLVCGLYMRAECCA
jgi:hypothetical protein